MAERGCWRVAAALATLTLAVAGCGAGEEQGPGIDGESFGINGQDLRVLAARGDTEGVDRRLAAIAGGGLAFVRAPIDWRELQPIDPAGGPPRLDFADLDRWVGALADHGLRWQAALLGTPGPDWALDPAALAAGCGSGSHPADPAEFAAMAGAVAERYGEGGTFWAERPSLDPSPVTDFEIWNEPNLAGFWCPVVDPAAYAQLAIATSTAIRDADPRARIVLGGLSTQPADTVTNGALTRQTATGFIDAAIEAEPELAEAIDVAALHSYGPTPADVLAHVLTFRADLDRLGMEEVAISLNEVGWTTQGAGGFPPVSEETRASYLDEMTREVAESGCDVVTIAPYAWTTEQIDPADTEDWFGIADPASGEPYPSGEAYLDAVGEARESGDPGAAECESP